MSYEYTWHNYLRWGYDADIPFSEPPVDPDQVRLWFDISPSARGHAMDMSIREASCLAANSILHQADLLGKRVSLSLSGGIDSEAMLHAFLLVCGEERPFRCTIFRFNDGINWHETDLASRLCERHRVEYEFIDVNLFDLWYRLPTDLEQFRIASGVLYAHLHAYAQRPDTMFVRGGNPVIRVDRWNPTHVGFEMYSGTTIVERYWRKMNRPGIPRFHLYTPDQMLAWLNHPVVQAWQTQLRGSQLRSFSKLKPIIYQIEFPEIVESRKKWTGSEFLTNHINDLWFNQWGKYLSFNPSTVRPINDLIDELRGVG